MNETLAKYSFLPWVRQGLGNNIIEADTLGGNLPNNAALERPDVQVSAKIKASKEDVVTRPEVSKTVKIQGPCDVLGINQRTIIRVHPKKGVTNFETNNLCYIEFYEEDLPWRFTPAKPVGNKLRPWLALIVLRNDEFTRDSSGATPTPFISINKPSLTNVFCNEKDIYALAHVHVLEDLGSGSEATDLQNKLAQNPDLALSRVLCPRKLEYHANDNEYHAFLIPAFETGRLAGLGQATEAIKAQEPSWSRTKINNGTNPVAYPYYFSWSFNVSEGGDFESLAEKLTARELPTNVGKREMDLQNMGFGIEPSGPNALGFVEGAMRHEDFVTAPWPVSGTELKEQLKDVLNISADLQDELPVFNGNEYFYSPALELDPIISPPTYGKWHQGSNKLAINKTDWLHQLNLHPSHRAAAGLGTRVVQQHQEEFMEMAWEQIGEINEANQKIIENELSKRVANVLLKKRIGKMSQVDVMAAAGQAFNVMKFGQETFKKSLVKSQVPTALRSGAFVKVANNFTPTALMTEDASDGAKQILSNAFYNRVNAEEGDDEKISAAPISKVSLAFTIPLETIREAISYAVNHIEKTFMQHLAIAIKAEGKDFNKNNVLANLPADFTNDEKNRASAILDGITTTSDSNLPDNVELLLNVKEAVFNSKIGSSFDEGIYENVKFVKAAAVATPLLFDQSVVLENRLAFQESFEKVFIRPNARFATVFTRSKRATLRASLRSDVLKSLNPFITYKRKLGAWLAEDQANNSKPIMAYPRFPIPTYDYLKEISADYIIPNISEIDPDTITLMEPNKKFIEAFLAGMNHEFSRELLWREFPTDMRGSYFRHFWEYNNNPNAEIQANETTEAYVNRILEFQNNAADVEEMHKWKANLLGGNHKGGPKLVLLIKGDLLRKYPGTLVYAQKANYDGADKTAPRVLGQYLPEDTNSVKWPIITGNLEPDVYFFGFDLDKVEANGNRIDEAGWFFVLRERPGQISFGLDDLGNEQLLPAPDSWDGITWEHISNNPNQQPDYLKVSEVNIQVQNASSAPNNQAQWGAASSDMAYILYQSPVLFARHASTMLNE